MLMTRVWVIAWVIALSLVASAGRAQECGDADGSGHVTVSDGVQTLRAAADLSSDCTVAVCDVDGSGAITVTDGVLVLRKAAGLATSDRCASVGDATLNTGARQLIVNNPFRDLTKIPFLETSSARPHLHALSALHQDDATTQSAANGMTNSCRDGGTETRFCEVRRENDGSNTTIYTFERNTCTFRQNDGSFHIENGSQRFTIPDFADCTVQNPRFVDREVTEERFPLMIELRDPEGTLTFRESDDDISQKLFGDICQFSSGGFVVEESVRNLSGTDVQEVFADGRMVARIESVNDHVAQKIEASAEPACEPTYTRSAGSVRTVDSRLSEAYTTTFGDAGDLRYGLGDGTLLVDGGLTSVCGDNRTVFVYRTFEALIFDPSRSDDCPRGGLVEVSADGVIIGHLRFTSSGGIQATAADGRTVSFEKCSSNALLLRCG